MELKLPQPKVSMLLKDLRDMDVVIAISKGKSRYYTVKHETIERYLNDIKKIISDFESVGSDEIIVRRKGTFSN